MQFIKDNINIDFVGKRKAAFFFSLALILAALISVMVQGGLKFGIDFAGGTVVQVRFDKGASIVAIKKGLAEMGIKAASVQQFGEKSENEFLIRLNSTIGSEDGFNKRIEEVLSSRIGTHAEIRRIEMVGPQVGKDLREKALFALFYALLFITIYISGRFELKWLISGVMAGALMGAMYFVSFFKVSIPVLTLLLLIISLFLFYFLKLRYAMGAIVALIHDVMITIGVFSLFGKEFTLPIVAALLTIIGYSLNDTIIVFDRIRENRRKLHKNPLPFIINRSINETLSRTILTSLTTLVVLLCLFFFGGGIIHDFAFALIVGVAIGTYSSIFIASPILIALSDG